MKDKQPLACAGFKQKTLVLAITAALPVTMIQAQEVRELPTAQASSQTEDSYKVDDSTSLKYTQPLLNTAKTITVIPQSVLRDRNVSSLQDALRNVPGISLAAGEGGTPTGDQMTIRGFNSSNNIMIDGVRDVAGYTRDVYNTESIEVAKGPGSAVYGRGSAGGSINLQSKTASLDAFNDISVRLGSEGDYRTQLDLNTRIGETSALRLNLLADDGEVADRDEVENSKQAIAASFATGLGTDSRFNLNVEYQDQDNLPDYGLPWVSNGSTPVAELADFVGKAPPVDFSNFYGNVQRDFEDIEAISATAKYEKDINNSMTFRGLLRVGSVDRQSVVTAPRFIDLTTTTDVRLDDEKTRDTTNSLAVIQLDLLGSYDTGSIQHDFVVGVELSAEQFERWDFEANGTDNLIENGVLNDLFNPDPNIEFTGQYVRTGQSDDATADTIAIYAFDTLHFNEKWDLSIGLRYDNFKTEYFDDLSEDPTSVINTDENELSWNTGLVYKPSEQSSIYFGAGNAFTSSAEDVTASTRGNSSELDPEETLSLELGAKWELFDGRLNAGTAIFRTEKTNALTDDPTDPDGDTRADTLNGEQRVQGIELNAAGQITDSLSVTAGYTYQDSEITKAEGADDVQVGAELARTPEHTFTLWSNYDFNDKFSAGFGVEYVDEQYNSSTPETREIADSYVLLDLMLSYAYSNKLNFQLNGSNLTDEDYAGLIGGGHFVPGDGRYFSLNARYSF